MSSTVQALENVNHGYKLLKMSTTSTISDKRRAQASENDTITSFQMVKYKLLRVTLKHKLPPSKIFCLLRNYLQRSTCSTYFSKHTWTQNQLSCEQKSGRYRRLCMPYALCLGPDSDNKDNYLADPCKERYPTKFLQDVSEAGEPLQKYPVELILDT